MNSFESLIAGLIADKAPITIEDARQLLVVPQDSSHGNFSFPCFSLAKLLKKNPKLIAEELADQIILPVGLAKVEALNGYLNFYMDRAFLASKVLLEIEEKKLNYGHAPKNNKSVVIDFSSPNMGKELAFHHLRSTMIGNSLSKIYEANGYKVERVNHLGDWGTAFGKLIVMYLKENLPLEDQELEKLSVKELNLLYASFANEAKSNPEIEEEARKAFTRLEQGDALYRKLWAAFKEATLKELRRLYQILGVSFDHYVGESFFEDKIPAVIETLQQKKLLIKSQDLDVVMLEDKKLPPCLIRKSDGSTLYATRDLAAAIYRKETFDFEKCLYVVDLGQSLHFKQVFEVLKQMDYAWSQDLLHIPFGLILQQNEEGKWEKGKTRTGTASLLRDVIEAATQKILDFIEEKNPNLADKKTVATQIGVSALVFNDLKNKRLMDVKFDWDAALSFEGATGPYVQNALVRLYSIMRKAAYTVDKNDVQWDQIIDDTAYELIKTLGRKEENIRKACEANEPSILAQYALDIAEAAHRFIHHNRVLGSPEEQSRLFLVQQAQTVLENTIELLGLYPIQQM